MFSEPIEFPGAVVKTVTFKKKDGVNQTRIDIQCGVTEAVARELGCRDVLYLKNGAPRQGFTDTDLDTGCKSLRALFQPDKTLKQHLEINGDQAEAFHVQRTSSGDYRLSFQLHCSIAPLEIWNYVDKVGDAPAVLKLAPLQQLESCPPACGDRLVRLVFGRTTAWTYRYSPGGRFPRLGGDRR